MEYRAALFDLDGTLLDTLAEIAGSANHALEVRGHPAWPHDAYRDFIGAGIENLFRRALPQGRATPEEVNACIEAYREEYSRALDRGQSRPYQGIPALLDGLAERGLAMAVLSNKQDAFTRRCVADSLASWRFEAVFGERAGVPRKPDPAGALEVAALLDVPPERFLYLGDTEVDMQTARAAGMRAIGVAWGFRPAEALRAAGAEVLVDHPRDVLAMLDRG